MATDIAVTQQDFEELREDLSESPLWNKDLAPTSIKERTWSTWNIAALWIGMSVVITTYTLAGRFYRSRNELVASNDYHPARQTALF